MENETSTQETLSSYTKHVKSEIEEIIVPCSEQNFIQSKGDDVANSKILNSCLLTVKKQHCNVTNVKIEIGNSYEGSFPDENGRFIEKIEIPNEHMSDSSETNGLRLSKASKSLKSDDDVGNSIVINKDLPLSCDATTNVTRTMYEEKTSGITSHCETAGPSRVDCELLDRELQKAWPPMFVLPEFIPTKPQKKIQENKNMHCELQNRTVKEEVIESIENILDINESTPNLEENRFIEKRSGSPLKEIEIKREKLDDDFSNNQIYVKNEILDDYSFPNMYDIKEPIASTENMNNNKKQPHYSLSTLKICSLCDVHIDGSKDHVEEKHRNGIFFCCPFCESETRYSSRKLSYESKKHKRNAPFDCEFCDQKFHNWLQVSQHINDAHDDQVNKRCNMCGFEGASYTNLLIHILCDHNGQTLTETCQYCDFATMNPALMQMHIEAKHLLRQTGQQKQYMKKLMVKCSICDCELSSPRLLKRHMSFMHSKRDLSL